MTITKFQQFFERLTNAFPPVDRDVPPTSLYKFFRYYSRGFIKPIIGIAVIEATFAMLQVSIFAFMGQLVDWLSEHDRETFLAQEADALLWMSAVVLLFLPILAIGFNTLTFQTMNGNFPMSIRWRAHQYLLGQSMEFYQDEFAGRVSTKVMQTALSVRETVMKVTSVFVYVITYFTSMLFVLVTLNVWLMLPMLIWLGVYILLQRYFVPKIKKVSQEQADARSTMTGRIVDAYTNIQTVKLFAHTEREAEYAKDSMDEFLQTVYAQMRLIGKFFFSVEMINFLLIFVMGAVSIYLWLHEMVSPGAIAVGIAMAMRIDNMSHWIMFEVSSLFESIGTVTDGMNTLSKPQGVVDKPDAPKLTVHEGKIDFNAMNFIYGQVEDDKQKTVFDSLDLNIKAGEKIGLVGRSGAGKSTLVNLLLRFYDLQDGTIQIDGQNIADVKQDSLREHIAMVTQDTALLHRSVRDNILYGRPDATEEELMLAIKQAKADEFIHDLTDPKGGVGLDAMVGERGVKLSGGQRQRIAIARVLLKNAPILILDEATSALDSEVEAAIQESLDELMEGKTVIAIAHRLSTIAALDRLVVMDEGKIIEQGTHKELLEKEGVYAKLWAHQTGGFLGQE